VLELIKLKKIAAHTVKTIILDEADRLLDDNNISNVKAIIKSTLKERQLIVCSASISKETEERASEIMKEPAVIKVTSKMAVPDTIEHISLLTDKRDKIEVLRKLVRLLKPDRAIVFVGEREEIEIFTEKLKYHGFSAEAIHSANIKLDRKKVMDDFRAGKIQLLIASDVAARGLDIEGITHIFNINVPEDPKEYLHRVGRTGRNGKPGMAVTIAAKNELQLLKTYEKALKIKITPKQMRNGELADLFVKSNKA
jgi:superfamily II DNA/RNA helicase